MKKKLFTILLSVSLLFSLTGCAKEEPAKEPVKEAQTQENTETEETRTFTDSVGRTVTIPKELKKIAPSGPVAQLVLYTAAPDLLCGLAREFPETAKGYIDDSYYSLPVFGQFYGKNANLNMEALLAASPELVIDIGEPKENIGEELDSLSEQLGIPVVFIEATLPTMESAYTKLGELLGNTKECEELAEYCKELLEDTSKKAASIPEDEKKAIYLASGNEGLNTNASGSIHGDIVEQIGAVNAARVDAASTGGGSEVSLEQIFLWNPDIVLADTKELYEKLLKDPAWQDLEAVKNNQVYQIPDIPYSYINNPPSVNRFIGIPWLGSIVYPEVYTEDIRKEVTEFYQLFYHIELTEEQLDEIL